MADEEHDANAGGHTKGKMTPGKDKNRKLMAIGVGVAGIIIAYLLYSQGKKRAAGQATPDGSVQSVGRVQGAIADVTVPSGNISPSELMAQFANTIQADQTQYNTGFMNNLRHQDDLIAALAAHNAVPPPGPPVPGPAGPPGPPGPTPTPAPAPHPHHSWIDIFLPGIHVDVGQGWMGGLLGMLGTSQQENWPTTWAPHATVTNSAVTTPDDHINVSVGGAGQSPEVTVNDKKVTPAAGSA